MVRFALAPLPFLAALAGCGGGDVSADEQFPDQVPEQVQMVAVSDAGDLEASPDEVAAFPLPDPALVDWVGENYGDMGDITMLQGEVDLDGDGTREILAHLVSPMLCGSGGCNLVVLQRTGQGLKLLGNVSVAQLPIGVFESSTNGWRDLAVTVYGGGVTRGVARLPFGETAYARNPTVPPAQITQDEFETVIADR